MAKDRLIVEDTGHFEEGHPQLSWAVVGVEARSASEWLRRKLMIAKLGSFSFVLLPIFVLVGVVGNPRNDYDKCPELMEMAIEGVEEMSTEEIIEMLSGNYVSTRDKEEDDGN